MERIVVVGGGAGGLELATRLGRRLGRKKKAHVTLVDKNNTHLWKPLLHEVAAGSLDSDLDELNYRGHAKAKGFHFAQGALQSIDREQREIVLAPLTDSDGHVVLHSRRLAYDRLVLAVGSVTNDFGIEGIAEHCQFLDSPQQAERFHQRLLNAFLSLDERAANDSHACLNVAIVGGGATGVELAAELYNSVQVLSAYDLTHLSKERLKVTLLEAGSRLLPALPERIAKNVHQQLESLGVDVRVNAAVKGATTGQLQVGEERLAADLMVWAAGIKAPQFLAELPGLTTRRNNQLVVNSYFQTADEHIFALGDCCACPVSPDEPEKYSPPRAQTAHQMASRLGSNLIALNKGKSMRPFHYVDHGSLVSLSRFSAIGSLMGNRTRSMTIEGKLARLAYASLYRMHQKALHGWWRTLLLVLMDRVSHSLRPRLKLH